MKRTIQITDFSSVEKVYDFFNDIGFKWESYINDCFFSDFVIIEEKNLDRVVGFEL